VQRDRVRADHLDERADVLRADGRTVVLRDELRYAQIRDHKSVRRALAHDCVRTPQARVAQRRALAPDTDPEAVPRGGVGEQRVHLLGARVPAGHSCDHERKGERVPEQPRGEIDLRGVGRGERVVDEVHVVPPRRASGLDILFGRDPQVLGLAPLDRRAGRP